MPRFVGERCAMETKVHYTWRRVSTGSSKSWISETAPEEYTRLRVMKVVDERGAKDVVYRLILKVSHTRRRKMNAVFRELEKVVSGNHIKLRCIISLSITTNTKHVLPDGEGGWSQKD